MRAGFNLETAVDRLYRLESRLVIGLVGIAGAHL